LLLLATLLVLVSACLHGLWNALLKKARNLHAASLGILVISLAITTALVPLIPGPVFPNRTALAWALAAGLGEGCYFVALSRALRAAPLGWSYSWMRGLAMLLVWPVSLLWLGEQLRPLSALGVVVICLGLMLMGLARTRAAGSEAIVWAAATGILIAGYTLAYKLALAHGAHPVGLYAMAMGVALPVQVGIRVRRQGWRAGTRMPEQRLLVLAAGILCTGSFLLYLKALALEGAGAMATLRNTSIVFAVLFSCAIGERPTFRQWSGAALVTAGAIALAWPH
jgi:drug/metabolite transporter (DMT)-like permease